MSEKASASPDAASSSHNEDEKAAVAPEPQLADSSGRRQSVALNIVENPLKVRLASHPNLPP
jgi:hypothetical protein